MFFEGWGPDSIGTPSLGYTHEPQATLNNKLCSEFYK